jgi:phage/plasmid-like protein (TIGR03299 family)
MQASNAPITVSTQYARGEEAAVYGRFKENGYQVNPLVSQAGGTLITDSLSPAEAFRVADADFKVIKTTSNYEIIATGEKRVHQDYCSLYREDTGAPLGVMGKNYTPVQNDSLIVLFDYLRENVEIDNILTIRDGAKIFVSARCDIEGEITSGDKVRRYLHAFNSFDGSTSFGVFFSDVRLQCANQINYLCNKGASRAKSEGAGLVMRHTRSVETFAKALPQLINVEQQKFETDLSQLRPLTTTKLSSEQIKRVLESTYSDDLARPITDKVTKEKRARLLSDLSCRDVIHSHYSGETGFGVETGTAWGLFQAITQYETHDAGRLLSDTDRARARLESLWTPNGAGVKRITKAREALLALV